MKKTKTTRVLSVFLAFILVLGSLHLPAMNVSSATVDLTKEQVGNNTYVADPGTMDGWQTYFGENSTEFAGAVWSDKSVFTAGTNAFDNIVRRGGVVDAQGNVDNSVRLTDAEAISAEDNNFLVALSALGATKEIEGYSSMPTDTMLVLDLSQSMDNSNSVPSMIDAANAAIDRLLNLNNYNRVGVVLYSGLNRQNSSIEETGRVILPLGRYTTADDDKYLTYVVHAEEQYQWRNGQWVKTTTADTSVSLDGDIRHENGTRVTIPEVNDTNSNPMNDWTYKNTEGGTFTQNGLYIAYEQFKERIDANDTTIDTGNILGGTKRMPIYVLMSDGAPTTVDSDYNNIGDSDAGSGLLTCDEFGFLTQLTAAWVRGKTEDGYKTDAKFYTLGLNLSSQDADGQAIADSVLNPVNSTDGIKDLWDDFLDSSSIRLSLQKVTNQNTNVSQIPSDGKVTVTVDNDGYLKEPAAGETHPMMYVDRAFSATGKDELVAAFENIVEEIILQSKYYPTLVTSGVHNLDGYLTFGDEIGEFMEVKNIKGMVFGDKLFSGASFGEKLMSGAYGNAATYTEYGHQLLDCIEERLNIPDAEARSLLSLAWRDNQLGYTSRTEYSNYIGWYANANAEYIGFWDKDDTQINVPQLAKYKVKSYIFQGELGAGLGNVTGGDMMHVVVQVYEDIATGDQSVVWKVPATLIPLVTYSVTANSDSLLTADEITLERESADPLRLVFEVGLRDDINAVNLMDKMSKEDHTHPVTENDKPVGYAFYTNRWGTGDNSTDVDHLDPNAHLATVSHFSPSTQNERYYYTEDAIIYQLVNGKYVECNGQKPSGEGYYHTIQIIKNTGSGNKATVEQKYIAISPDVLSATGEFAIKQDDNGVWYVPAGQIMQQLTRFTDTKEANTTGTLEYTDYPVVDRPTGNENHDDYHIFMFLGNNGRLVLYAEQGIKLSKTIDDPAATDTFEFKIELDRTVPDSARVVDVDGNDVAYTKDGNVITVSIKNNETVLIVGLPTGTEYTVTESRHDNYKVESVTVNGNVVDGETAEGTITEHTYDDVAFVNTASSHAGDLEIIKTVTHDYGSEYVIPNKTFKVVVDLEGVTAGTKFATTGTVNGGTTINEVTVDADGNIVLNMAHEDSVVIKGIPEGTDYTVTEEDIPTGFTLDEEMSTDLVGTIVSDDLVFEHLYNDYESEDVEYEKVIVEIEKIYDLDLWSDEEFEFIVEKNTSTTGVPVWTATGIEGTISKSTAQPITLDLSSLTFDERGTYNFRISEVKGSDEHVVYDETRYYFNVVVTDQDMDGYLEISNVTSTMTTVQKSEEGNVTTYTVPVTFTNHYVTDPDAEAHVAIDIYKDIPVNETGVTIDKSQFEFGLYTDAECTTLAKDNAGNDIVVNASMVGEAAITLNYVAQDITFPEDEDSVTYTYYLKEIAGSTPGMTYDDTVYIIEVVVSEIGQGQIGAVATVKQGETLAEVTGEVVFNNEYELAEIPVVIDGTKTFTDKDNNAVSFADGDFEFVLYEADSAFEYNEETDEIDRVTNDGSIFEFDAIEYTSIGTHYYVVKEVVGTNRAIDYDPAEWHVTVVVAPHETEAKLVATVTNNQVGGNMGAPAENDIQFNNKYKIVEFATITLGGDKDLTGKTLTQGEFEFGLYSDAACTTLVVDKDGNEMKATSAATSGRFEFATIEYSEKGTYTYYIKEMIPADAADTDSDGKLNKGNYDYDATVHEVVVTVTDKGNGVLEANANMENTDIRFANEFTPDPVTIRLEATKLFVENDDNETEKDFDRGTFTFALYPATATDTGYVISGPAIAQLTNGQQYDINTIKTFNDDKVGFTLQYASTDVQYYVLKEIDGSDHTIRYDANQYEIEVTVTDYGDGVLVPTMRVDGVASGASKTDLEFKNVHTTVTVEDTINIHKNVLDNDGNNIPIGDYEFEFGLYSDADCTTPITTADGNHIKSVTDENGNATMRFMYDDSGMGPNVTTKSYTYYVREIIPANTAQVEGMVYDESIYKVEVALEYDENNSLGLTKTLTKIQDAEGDAASETAEAIEFNNKYETPNVTIEKLQSLDGSNFTKETLEVAADDEVTYRLVVTNNGDYVAKNVVVTDEIPEGLVYVSGGNEEDGIVTWEVGDLAAGASETVEFTVKVPVVKEATSWTNVASAVYDNNPDNPEDPDEPKTPIPSNEVEIETVIPNVTIEKLQSVGEGNFTKETLEVAAGDEVTYRLVVTNDGDYVAKNVVVTDEIPEGLVYVSGGNEEDGIVTWEVGDLAAGASETVEFTVKVPVVKEATSWTNVASAVYDNNPDNPEDPDEPKTPIPSNEVEIETVIPNVTIEKLQSVGEGDFTKETLEVAAGDEVTYRLVVTNDGDYVAKNVVVTDEVPVGLEYVSGGSEADGTVTWEVGDLAAGASETVEFTVKVPVVKIATSWLNVASVVYDNNPDNPEDPDEPKTPIPSNEVEIETVIPNVTIEKLQSVGEGNFTKETLEVAAGDEVTYRLVVTNDGDYVAKNVVVTDEVPEGLEYVSGGSEADGTVTWTIGDLAAGASETVEFTVKVPGVKEATSWTNVASAVYDNNPDNPEDPDEPKTPVPSNEVEIEAVIPNVTIEKLQSVNGSDFTDELLQVEVDDVVTYRIIVTNDGDYVAKNVVVTDEIPEGLQYVSGGNEKDGIVTWEVGDLAVGASETVEFKVKVPAVKEATVWKNIAVAVYDNNPDNPEDPDEPKTPVPSEEVIIGTDVPNVVIEKSQSVNGKDATKELLQVAAGDEVTYFITVTNNGENVAKDVVITDEIPEGLGYVKDSAKGGKLSVVEDGNITWEVGDLAVGESITVEFKVIVPTVKEATVWKNMAIVVYDNNPENPEDPDEPKTPVPSNEVEIESLIPKVIIEKTQSVNGKEATKELLQVTSGDEVTYFITVTNDGETVAKNVVVTDEVPEGLVYVSGGSEEDGTVTWEVGDLAVGERVTVELKVKVPTVKEATVWKNVATTVYDNNPDNPEDPDEPKTPVPSNEVEIGSNIPNVIIEKTQSVNGGKATKDVLQVTSGDVVTYFIKITNNGETVAKNVVVTDKVPTGLDYVKDSAKGAVVLVAADGTISWEVGDLAVGESITVEFKVKVPTVKEDTAWKNVATVVYDNNPGNPIDPDEPKTTIPSNEVIVEAEIVVPVTGDSSPIAMWLVVSIASLMVCAGVVIDKKRRYN